MFTGLYEQTVTEPEHVKMIEVDSKSGSRLEIFSNLANIQESFPHPLLVFVPNAASPCTIARVRGPRGAIG